MAYLRNREKWKYVLKKQVAKNAWLKIQVLEWAQSLLAIIKTIRHWRQPLRWFRVVSWQFHYHLNFLLAELCSKLGSQVEENILFPILFFQKATQKRPRAKGSNDLRMRYEDYCECSKLFTIWSAFLRLQRWRKTRICKTKCSQSCCRN